VSSQVRELPTVPDRQLDYTSAKLAFDRLIDPAVDEAAIRRELDNLAAQARAIAGPHATDEAKLNAVRRVIYRTGTWNGQNPFSYDLADPLGLNVNNKLLSTYLRTRRGNCVSMPTLFLILADRLGLNVSFATAPLHMFIRYTDPQGRAFDIETTSGANLSKRVAIIGKRATRAISDEPKLWAGSPLPSPSFPRKLESPCLCPHYRKAMRFRLSPE